MNSSTSFLSNIPEQWETIPLKYAVSSIETGERDSSFTPTDEDSGVLSIGGEHFDDRGDWKLDSPRYISTEMYSSMNQGIIEEGDVLLVKDGATTGKSAYVNEVPQDSAAANEHIYVLKPSDTLSGEFLSFVLRSRLTQTQISWFIRGSAQAGLPSNFAGEVYIPVPPYRLQQDICNKLRREVKKTESAIDELSELYDLFGERKSSLLTSLVTQGEKESFNKNTDIPWVSSIPEDWEIVPLKYVANVRTGIAKGRSTDDNDLHSVPYLRVANVQEGYLDLSEIKELELTNSEIERYALKEGDVLMNEGGDYDKLGRGTVWNGQIEPCVHQNHVFCVRPHQREDSEWISFLSQSKYLKHYFMMNAKRTTNLASISASNISSAPLVWPPKEVRKDIVEQLKSINNATSSMKEKITKQKELLKEKKQSKITKAITGEINITV